MDSQKQSRWTSLIEAHANALVGAPPAILANWLLLDYFYPKNADSHFAAMWAIVTWPVFFYLSVGRGYLVRRTFEKYGVDISPRGIWYWMKTVLRI